MASKPDMRYKQKIVTQNPKQVLLTILQPLPAWIAILAFIFLSVILILAGAGKILNIAFPAGAFLVAIFLYFRAPILYLGFAWWICFLSGLVRRLADYRSGFTEPSPILIAPFLVVLVTLVTLYQNLPKAYKQGGLPFILCFASIFWGVCLGVVRTSPISVAINGLKWLTPVLLGFHLFVNWRSYLSYRQNIQRVFFWGVLIMGSYGLFQYLVAPEWDTFWLKQAEFLSAGTPEALRIRIWSTMNGYYTFAVFIMAGTLTLTNQTGLSNIVVSAVGYLTLLLAKSRTAWLGWVVAFLVLFSSLKSKHQIRLIVIFVLLVILLIPLIRIESFSNNITSRLSTLSDLQNDNSGQGRLVAYDIFFREPLMALLGIGIGNKEESVVWDSGILAIFSSLGWIGSIFYLAGILKLIFDLWQFARRNFDPFLNIASGIAMSILFMSPLAVSFADVHGICLWGFLGMGLAGCKYHQNAFAEVKRCKAGRAIS